MQTAVFLFALAVVGGLFYFAVKKVRSKSDDSDGSGGSGGSSSGRMNRH